MKSVYLPVTVSFIINTSYTRGDSLKQPSGKLKYLPNPTLAPILTIPRRHTDSQVQKSTLLSHPSKTDVTAQIGGSASQKLYASGELRRVYIKYLQVYLLKYLDAGYFPCLSL